jgi:hypothetical protein
MILEDFEQACEGMHPRPDISSPSTFFPIFCFNLRKKRMKNPRKTHPFDKPDF